MSSATSSPPLAVIFDFDGVLVDSELYWAKEEREFFHRVSRKWQDRDHHRVAGMRMQDIYGLFVREYGTGMSLQEFMDEFEAIAGRVYARARPSPGLKTCLDNITGAGLRLAVASSMKQQWIDLVLRRHSVRDAFEIVVGAEDIGDAEGKPAPTVYLLAAKLLKLPPHACVAVEDAKNGVMSALAAGMKSIGLQYPGNHQDLSAATVVVESLKDIDVEMLKKLEG